MSTFDKIQKFLESALPGVFVDDTLKGLRRRGIKDVKLVTRKELDKLISDYCKLLGDSDVQVTGRQTNTAKRVELLLIEIERLRKEKSDLEHQRGLVENERAELSGRLDEIVNAGSKAFGEKINVDDIRNLLVERSDLRAELDAHKVQGEQTRTSYEETVTALRIKQSSLEQSLDNTAEELKNSQVGTERLRSELEASRNLAANNKRRSLELEQELEEMRSNMREALAEKAQTIEEFETQLAERDKTIEELKNPTAEEAAEPEQPRVSSKPATRSLGRRPATRRLNRTRKVRDTTSFDFTFSANGQSESKSTRRRRRGS